MFTHSFSLLFRERLPENWRALRYINKKFHNLQLNLSEKVV